MAEREPGAGHDPGLPVASSSLPAERGKDAPATVRRCLFCGGETTPGYLANSDSGHAAAFHGREKNALGMSVHRTTVEARICVECGFVAVFGRAPDRFREETVEWRQARSPDLTPAERPAGRGDEVAGE